MTVDISMYTVSARYTHDSRDYWHFYRKSYVHRARAPRATSATKPEIANP
jgi:hypothetical protein